MSESVSAAEVEAAVARAFGRAVDDGTFERDRADLVKVGLSEADAEAGARGLQSGTYQTFAEAATIRSAFGSGSGRASAASIQVVEAARKQEAAQRQGAEADRKVSAGAISGSDIVYTSSSDAEITESDVDKAVASAFGRQGRAQ